MFDINTIFSIRKNNKTRLYEIICCDCVFFKLDNQEKAANKIKSLDKLSRQGATKFLKRKD